MISERKFIVEYGSFWRELLPMAERFTKAINLSAEIHTRPIPAVTSDRVRASMISELGFRLAARPGEIPDLPLKDDALKALREFASNNLKYLLRFPGFGGLAISTMHPFEVSQSVSLARSIREFLEMRGFSTISYGPSFSGCGVIDDCFGDILADKTLIEVKTVDRQFRTADIRQLLTYCALNYAKDTYRIEKLCLLNPLQGRYFVSSPTVMCREMGGVDECEVLQAIIEFVCNVDRLQD